jgi:transposase
MKKTYNGEFKKKVVLEALKEEKTISQIASEYEIDSRQIFRWRNLVTEKMPELFDNKTKGADEIKGLSKKLEESYAEIGKLTTQLNWLKKKCGIRTD